MMLLKMELGHIWKPKLLLILLAAGLLYGFLFLEFPLNYFPNGHPAEEQFQLMADWSERYGMERPIPTASSAMNRMAIVWNRRHDNTITQKQKSGRYRFRSRRSVPFGNKGTK